MAEKRLDRKIIFNGHVLNLYLDTVLCDNGKISTREIIHHNGGVCILPIDNENNIILEKQFRYAYEKEIYELPAGKLEKNESPHIAAIRELEEETGYHANELIYLGEMYPSCGYTDEIIYLYLAKSLIKTKQNLDDDENLDIIKLPFQKVIEMIKSNVIQDAKTICAIFKYQLYTS